MIMCPLLSTVGNFNYLVIYSLHVNFKFHFCRNPNFNLKNHFQTI